MKRRMWGSCVVSLWGGRDTPRRTREAELKKRKQIFFKLNIPWTSSSKRRCGNCMILYLFHLIFKILFFFQVLYILTLKIIIDMCPGLGWLVLLQTSGPSGGGSTAHGDQCVSAGLCNFCWTLWKLQEVCFLLLPWVNMKLDSDVMKYSDALK